jgi:hypothetical protein
MPTALRVVGHIPAGSARLKMAGLRVWSPHSTSFPGSQNNIRRDVKSSCDIPRGCDRLTLFTLSLHLCDS